MTKELDRRTVLRLFAGGAATALLPSLSGCDDAPAGRTSAGAHTLPELPRHEDFSTAPGAEGWGGQWASAGVANLRREQGAGMLEAGSDIFPNDPRPVVFAVDSRTRDARIRAVILRTGSAVGLVLRRQSPRNYYAAVYDTDQHTLSLQRRSGFDLVNLASTLVLPTALLTGARLSLEFEATSALPTRLRARLTGADGPLAEVASNDSADELQGPGDAGVLTQADTLLPDSNPLLPALGNLHLVPYTIQEGQGLTSSTLGAQLFETIRRRSTASFAEITIESAERPQPSAASVIAATTGAPLPGGATLLVASDLPAQVVFEVARTADFSGASLVPGGSTDAFNAAAIDLAGLRAGIVYWRARLYRADLETVGPIRSFRVLPDAGDAGCITLAYGSCGSQFNAIYDHIAARQPEVFIWQGDLNYPDAHGPLAQSMSGYAGAWRHFLDNPRLAAILQRSCFVAGRDDHDYGLQDANAGNLLPWGLAPWESLMNPRTYQRFTAGPAEVWVLDQRQFKDDPTLPDTPDKSLLGAEQRQWLLESLSASSAPFKIICSPTTLAPSGAANARDGSWAAGFTAERDLLLEHLRRNVSGQTIFLSGDTHFTMLWERDGLFEQRACPLDIPLPNDISIANPALELTFGSTPGVLYWSRRSHFSLIKLDAEAGHAEMTVELVRDDGVTVHSRRFESVY